MNRTLTHRGPDDEGFFFDDEHGLGLGFRRLAIIDLSPAAHQPMSNEDGSLWIVFNGEVYNFLTLRPQLEKQGHRFRSQSDTEVLLHLYEEAGENLPASLHGMFALAIWDQNQQRMFLSRDRLGKKPLYYYDDGKRLLFASELKAILKDPDVPRVINLRALAHYLTFGYVLAPLTIFENIFQLPPACQMIVQAGNTRVKPYWDWFDSFKEGLAVSSQVAEETVIEQLKELLKEVVSERLISDVPLGAFLSGGVDSSAVVAMMASLSNKPVKTFSIGFSREAYNELPYARMVAQRFSTEHHEFIVEPEDLRDVMPRLVKMYDEPFADSSAVPTYYLSKCARQEVIVCLSGDGGDEAMAGYTRYAQMQQESLLDGLPSWMRRTLLGGSAKIVPYSIKGSSLLRRIAQDPLYRYQTAVTQIPRELLKDLLHPNQLLAEFLDSQSPLMSALEKGRSLDLISRLQFADGVTYLPGDILIKVDRASMANSLEVRCPLLDHRFMEFMAHLPADFRFRHGQGKYIFKKAMEGILPNGVIYRKKMGFGIPLQEWFSDDLHSFAAEILLDDTAKKRGLWNPTGMEKLIQLASQRQVYSLQNTLWVLLVLELWQREYL